MTTWLARHAWFLLAGFGLLIAVVGVVADDDPDLGFFLMSAYFAQLGYLERRGKKMTLPEQLALPVVMAVTTGMMVAHVFLGGSTQTVLKAAGVGLAVGVISGAWTVRRRGRTVGDTLSG